jgi:hypothetical protein
VSASWLNHVLIDDERTVLKDKIVKF